MACKRLDKAIVETIVKDIDNILLDCDGVLWTGQKGTDVVPRSVEAVNRLKEMGKRIFYITNNSVKSRAEYAAKCNGLGFKATEDQIVCTAYAAAQYLHNINFKGKIYVVGNPSICSELDKFGFSHFGMGVNCTLVGFDPHFSYLKLVKAASYAVRDGSLFLATNEDPRMPMDSPVAIPGTGSIVAAVKAVARKEPVVMGKPEPTMFKCLQDIHNLDPSRSLMVGDTCNTDIAMATNCGLKSLLVLSGTSTLAEVEKYKNSNNELFRTHIPDYYSDLFGDIVQFL